QPTEPIPTPEPEPVAVAEPAVGGPAAGGLVSDFVPVLEVEAAGPAPLPYARVEPDIPAAEAVPDDKALPAIPKAQLLPRPLPAAPVAPLLNGPKEVAWSGDAPPTEFEPPRPAPAPVVTGDEDDEDDPLLRRRRQRGSGVMKWV